MIRSGTGPEQASAPVAPATVARVVDLARRAPSIHNTQPWAWYAGRDHLELWADRGRALMATDPDGRGLAISCGAALHHALVVADALGLRPQVVLLPEDTAADFLARVHLRPGGHVRETPGLFEAIERRCTDRRRFTSWPVPADTVEQLVTVAETWGVTASPVTEPATRSQVEVLTEQARTSLEGDPEIAQETRRWLDHGAHDGIPSAALPPMLAGTRPHRFQTLPAPEQEDTRVASTDDLLVLSTQEDTVADWLRAGEALSALWLETTRVGLSVVPLSEAVEYDECREALRAELGLRSHEPQLLLRLGWQHIGRGSLRRTPRRPLDEVFHPWR